MQPAGRSQALQTLSLLQINQAPTRRKVKTLPPNWHEHDCHGNVEKAERELFRKLIEFLHGGRNIPTLFRRMNVNEDGRLEARLLLTVIRHDRYSLAFDLMFTLSF